MEHTNMRKNPYNGQVGGAHYDGMAIQPITISLENGYDAAIHSAVKYVARHREKGGKEDLLKAEHFCRLRLEAIAVGAKIPPAKNILSMTEFIRQNQIEDSEAHILLLLDKWATQELSLTDPETASLLYSLIGSLAEATYPT